MVFCVSPCPVRDGTAFLSRFFSSHHPPTLSNFKLITTKKLLCCGIAQSATTKCMLFKEQKQKMVYVFYPPLPQSSRARFYPLTHICCSLRSPYVSPDKWHTQCRYLGLPCSLNNALAHIPRVGRCAGN